MAFDDRAVVVRDPTLEQLCRSGGDGAGQPGAEVLQQERDAAERSSRGLCPRHLARAVEQLQGNGVECGIALFRAFDRRVEHLQRRQFAARDQTRQIGGVQMVVFR